MNEDLKDLLKEELVIAAKAMDHLLYSFDRTKSVLLRTQMSRQDYEILDSFSSRYMRMYKVITNQLLRTILELMNEKMDNRRDDFNKAEKLNLITTVEELGEVRKNSNKVAHEYTDEEWITIYQDLIDTCPILEKSYLMIIEQIKVRSLT